MLLEPCDINAAIEKILSETWHSGPGNMWAVSTIVVQESIYKKFEEVLKLQLQNFIYYNSKSNFQDKFILNQIQSVIKKAAKTGAKIIKKNDVPEAEWSPTFLLQYFDQDIEPSVPVIRILICRTAKEGVTLVNHTRYCLGTSIWTCISSQALECAPMLNSNYIWINCHGRILSSAPFNPPGFSGNATFGGTDGEKNSTAINCQNFTVY